MSDIMTGSALRALIAGWLDSGKQVAAPAEAGGRLLYQHIASAEQAVFNPLRRPTNSIKDFVFPRHERLFHYTLAGKAVELEEAPGDTREQVIIGAKPCDAASLAILDSVFHWDFQDKTWDRGRARTTVVTLACGAADDACFCTSVGSGPADQKGSDAMLFALDGDRFLVEALTDKGRALFAGKTETADASAPVFAGPAKRFDRARIEAFLASGFEAPFWKDETVPCLGCGVCAYSCPTCHCFDIVDEGNAAGGERVRNWDSCQFPMFTLHASGHNPRSVQSQRQRQRVYHKFSTYPQKFGGVLCTGCGNCARNCPVGLGVLRVLEAIDLQAQANNERESLQA